MSKFILMVETGADVWPEMAERYGIQTVPMHVTFGDTSLDDATFPVEKLFEYYESTHTLPRTSGCTPEDFTCAFDEVHQKYPDKHILHLAYSSVTTCSTQSAMIAAQGRDYVTIIDTKVVSVGQMAVVKRVAELMEKEPDITLEKLLNATKEIISKVKMAFFPGDLAYLRAGGRVSNLAYLGATLLHLHPLIELIDGYLASTKKYRGSKAKVIEKMVQEYIVKRNLKKDHLWLAFSSGLDESIKTMVTETTRAMGFKNTTWVRVGCVITSHCGPGGFGLCGFEA